MIVRLALLIFALAVASPAFGETVSGSSARIVVPAHDIVRGQVIGDGDLVTVPVAAASIMPGLETSISELVGMEARRVLRAGEAIRFEDVRRPILVTRGSTVTMTFSVPGITLTAVGRAMSEGGYGETVTVQNPASFRQISAIVTGPGQVRAGANQSVISSTSGPALVASANR